MSVRISESAKGNYMLRFKRDITLEDFGKLLAAYDTLITILEGRNATYTDFIEWVETHGYAERDDSQDVPEG